MVLDRSSFLKCLADEFELSGALTGAETLIDDLEFDSLQLLRLSIFIKDRFGSELPEQVDYDTLKVDDVWYYYHIRASQIQGSETQ